jgi:hypothetical protein
MAERIDINEYFHISIAAVPELLPPAAERLGCLRGAPSPDYSFTAKRPRPSSSRSSYAAAPMIRPPIALSDLLAYAFVARE